MVLHNRRIAIGGIADDVGISFGLEQAILTNVLAMKHARVNIVPKLLKKNKNWILVLFGRCWRYSRRSIFPQKGLVTNHGCMTMTSKIKRNHSVLLRLRGYRKSKQ